MITNELLLNCIEKDVLKLVLGTKVILEAIEKLNKKTEKEQNEIKEFLIKEAVKRKLRILKGELDEEGIRKKYTPDFLISLLGEKGIKEKDLDKIAQELKLNEVSYYLTYFKNSNKKTYLYEIKPKEDNVDIKKHLKKINKEFLEKRFKELVNGNSSYNNHQFSLSEYCSPILRKLKSKPIPYTIIFESKNCIFIDFWTIGEERIYFDAKEGDFKPIFPRQQVLCRIHLDKAIMELQEVESCNKNTDNVLFYLQTLLKNDEVYFKKMPKISEGQFRSLESHIKKSHEKHEGNEASSALTRTRSDGDTRNDKAVHNVIKDRPFSILNGVIQSIPNLNYPVTISLNKSGYFMINTKKVTPSERKIIIDWLLGVLL